MFLFQCDLLPGLTGKILRAKDERDNVTAKVVDRRAQIIAAVVLMLMIVGMLFYVFLFALTQTKARQTAWLQSFLLWFLLEVAIVSSLTVLVLNVAIPSIAMRDIVKNKERVKDQISNYYLTAKTSASAENAASLAPHDITANAGVGTSPFNAAKFLYVSTLVAQHFPALKESKIIASFSTPWPVITGVYCITRQYSCTVHQLRTYCTPYAVGYGEWNVLSDDSCGGCPRLCLFLYFISPCFKQLLPLKTERPS